MARPGTKNWSRHYFYFSPNFYRVKSPKFGVDIRPHLPLKCSGFKTQQLNRKSKHICIGSADDSHKYWLGNYARLTPNFYRSLKVRNVALGALWSQPAVETEHNLDTAARRFSVAAPRLWNSLPLNCRTAPSVNTFKTRLKTFLFASA